MARQGNPRRGLEEDHGRREPEARRRHAVQRPAHVLGRLRADRRHREAQRARATPEPPQPAGQRKESRPCPKSTDAPAARERRCCGQRHAGQLHLVRADDHRPGGREALLRSPSSGWNIGRNAVAPDDRLSDDQPLGRRHGRRRPDADDEMQRGRRPADLARLSRMSTTSMPRSQAIKSDGGKVHDAAVGHRRASAGSRWSPTRRARPST